MGDLLTFLFEWVLAWIGALFGYILGWIGGLVVTIFSWFWDRRSDLPGWRQAPAGLAPRPADRSRPAGPAPGGAREFYWKTLQYRMKWLPCFLQLSEQPLNRV